MKLTLNQNKIFKGVKGKIRLKEPLKGKTTFKIGGRAKFFIGPKDVNDLKLLVTSAKRYKIPIFVIGAGSNILIDDQGVDGLVLQLNSPYFKTLSFEKKYSFAGSGLTLKELVLKAGEHGLSGVEFLAGIPGTVGGALVMNAGAWGKNIGDLVEKASVIDYNGNMKILNKNDIKFEYRKSSLAKYIILSVTIKLTRKNREVIEENIRRYLRMRRNRQDTSLPDAGCIFKNPPGKSAGRLIDLCGLKGKKIGGACISQRHANFILNRGNAKAKEILLLMSLVKRHVKRKFKISLEPEIKIWK